MGYVRCSCGRGTEIARWRRAADDEPQEEAPIAMVENINRIGEMLGVLWSFFQNEAGELTVAACLLLATAALVTAYRCLHPVRTAIREEIWPVAAVGSGITAVFVGVGLFFVSQAIR